MCTRLLFIAPNLCQSLDVQYIDTAAKIDLFHFCIGLLNECLWLSTCTCTVHVLSYNFLIVYSEIIDSIVIRISGWG